MSSVFHAPDIECEQCAEAIRQVLTKLDGVRTVEVDVEACTVSVELDAAAGAAESTIRAVLEEAGYPTTP